MLRFVPGFCYGQTYGKNLKKRNYKLTAVYFMAILVVIVLSYPLFRNYYIQTYLWQSTSLANQFRPVYRKNCLLPTNLFTPERKDKLKIGMLYTNKVDLTLTIYISL